MILVFVFSIIIVLCLIAQGFFAASEMALISLDYIKIKNKAEQGDRYARIIAFFLEHPKILFSTTLLGVNLAIILSSVTASSLTRIVLKHHSISVPYQVQSVISTSVMVPLILFFGEIIPMGFSRLNPEWIVSKGILFFNTLRFLMYPLTTIVSGISTAVSKITGADMKVHASLTTREELESYISNSFTASETSPVFDIGRIIDETFMFSKTPSLEIMTPLSDVIAVPHTAAKKDIWNFAGKHGHSRLPIYRNKKENIIGYINAVDIIHEENDFPVTSTMHSPLIVSETITLSQLLSLMQKKGEHIAFPTDQFGSISGIVTDEDIVENIFGGIYDEYDRNGSTARAHDYMYAEPSIAISELNRLYGLDIPESDHYSTLSGCILHKLKRIPSPGTKVHMHGLVVTIEEVRNNTINKVSLAKDDTET